MDPVPLPYRQPDIARRIVLIEESYRRLLGLRLVPDAPRATAADLVSALWTSPLAIVAHGPQDDPVFFFGSRAALAAFDCDAETFIGMPSRLSAEAPLRAERQAMLDRVRVHGFIDDYRGVRISARGRRFEIGPACVWDLIDDCGARLGQAACFTP